MKTPDFSNVKFFKSSYSADASTCVEVSFKDGCIAVRDSKNPEQGLLVFNKSEWEAFIKGVKSCEFDLS
ncbi:DUF397 domain-containing protein [Chroococcidiopsis sp. CCALA 051]|uniref:DUF397 domain-containing protein n=1 Tax=Chroococcidiopsis sp. CCALA 051 TaxID=869949 RepID=UPI000D0CAE21|nr:DUF397 domain-containing protein [Chroococcidiopsidales cyanobacterium LEGE 13417]PSM46082.1 DUF397 domain-containing protein [Chroococcidiopsis sp. CCALA 051]